MLGEGGFNGMNVVDEIKSRLDIVDFISETVSLKKAGKSYTGFCPFHQNTRTPSFIVFPDTQSWRCFGACADGGDIFSFVMKREGIDFREALQLLAKRAGVELETPEPQAAEQDQRRQKLLDLQTAAADYFHHLLTVSPVGAQARHYLSERELTADTIATFQLGYAPDEWEALKSHFTGRGYEAELLVAAGLVVERDDGTPGYDRFRNRLMIPIRDARGRVVGFGARALSPDQVPKYLNSPQTVLFDKSATLYGLDLARSHIRSADQVVIVEGYMDVIQAHQRGAKNVVAQMGTALTEQQIKILKRTTNHFILALDADTAGQAATLRGLDVAREVLDKETVPVITARGLIRYESRLDTDIRIAALPAGRDPDDILKEGLEAWQNIIDQAVPVIDFYFQAVTAELDLNSAKGKSVAVRELIPVLRDIGNRVEQEHYIQKLARLIHIDERTLIEELKRERKPRSTPRRQPKPAAAGPVEPPAAPPKMNLTAAMGLEEYCLGLVVSHPAALAIANDILEQREVAGLSVHDFKRGDNREIFKSLQLWTAAESPKIEVLHEMIGPMLMGRLATLASLWHRGPPTPLENVSRDFSMAILRLRLRNLNEQIEELQFLLSEAEAASDTENARRYREMISACSEQRRQLHDTSDALSLVGRRRAEVNM
jgi:DNA primase